MSALFPTDIIIGMRPFNPLLTVVVFAALWLIAGLAAFLVKRRRR